MDVIFVNYSPFTMESKVEVFKDGQENDYAVASSVEELAKTIVGIAYKDNIYEAKIAAPFATGCEIKRQIAAEESRIYSENKIKVESI